MPSVNLTTVATAAAQQLGVLDSGEGLSAQQLADTLATTNNILDNWSSDSLFIVGLTSIFFSGIAGQQAYNVSTFPGIATPRPVKIQGAEFFNSSGSGGPVKVLNVKEWTAIEDKESQSNRPQGIYYDAGFPTAFIWVTPIPLSNNPQIQIRYWAPITEFADTTTPITIYPGYLWVIELAVGLGIAGAFSMPIPASLSTLYADAAGRIRRLNAAVMGDVPPELVAEAQAPK